MTLSKGIRRSGWLALCVAVLPLLMAGCVRDNEPEGPCTTCPPDTLPAGQVAVAVRIGMGTDWSLPAGVKAAPPGQTPSWEVDGTDEAAGTDEVRIIAFRRKDRSDLQETGNNEPFLYDPTNDLTVPCVKVEGQHRLQAEGVLVKSYGYEYRVLAIAYDSDRTNDMSNGALPATGEEGLFSLNLTDGLSYDDFMATLTASKVDGWEGYWEGGTLPTDDNNDPLSPYAVYGPQLFYGLCTDGTGGDIIRFAVGDDKELPLTGVLYRGLAKLEVHLEVEEHKIGALKYDLTLAALLADNVRTRVRLTDYDDFLTPLPSSLSGYTLVAFKGRSDVETGSIVFTAYMLPTATRLAIRVMASRPGLDVMQNGRIHVKNISFADGATGIISPDVQDDVFYLRRNHRYVLTGTTGAILKNDFE